MCHHGHLTKPSTRHTGSYDALNSLKFLHVEHPVLFPILGCLGGGRIHAWLHTDLSAALLMGTCSQEMQPGGKYAASRRLCVEWPGFLQHLGTRCCRWMRSFFSLLHHCGMPTKMWLVRKTYPSQRKRSTSHSKVLPQASTRHRQQEEGQPPHLGETAIQATSQSQKVCCFYSFLRRQPVLVLIWGASGLSQERNLYG